jgi:hypothetical protein
MIDHDRVGRAVHQVTLEKRTDLHRRVVQRIEDRAGANPMHVCKVSPLETCTYHSIGRNATNLSQMPEQSMHEKGG